MYTIIVSDNDELLIYCPFCKNEVEEGYFNIDDYCSSNSIFWCTVCYADAMICPGPHNKENNIESLNTSKCSKLLLNEELNKFIVEFNIDVKKYENPIFYKVHLVAYTHIQNKQVKDSDSDIEEATDPRMPYHILKYPVFNLRDVDKCIDTQHDCLLAYKGVCSGCCTEYCDYIWGD